MEEQELRCPWCGGPLEKGQLRAPTYVYIKDGGEIPLFYNVFKTQVEGEEYIAFRNWTEAPTAYACRSCRKIILPY